MIRDLQQQIFELKKERDICILAHSYMSEEICEVADFTGDSYALSVKAKTVPQSTVIMCGVRFMEEILRIKKDNPDIAVVAYVNTTAELKTVADVCVTSSSAVKICRVMPEKNILFIPDINLGTYVKSQVPEKNFKLLSGGCPVHAKAGREEAIKAKATHPDALFLVHPECRAEVVELADFVGSTSGIMDFAEKSEAKEFIIGTENAIVQHLQFKCRNKKFYPLSKDFVCRDMKITTLPDVLNCVLGRGGEEIVLEEGLRKKAVKCIERMIELGG